MTLVTGASSGIGAATAVDLAGHGHRVVLSGRDARRLAETRDQLVGDGHVVLPADLTDPQAPSTLVQEAVAMAGPLDGLVHCAGRQVVQPVRSSDPATVDALLALNVTSALQLARAFRLRRHRTAPASIVLVSSVLGLVGQPGAAAYSASKGAVVTLTRSLALELARDDIRVNCVCPGTVETPMLDAFRRSVGDEAFDRVAADYPLGIGRPEHVASAVRFLLSSDAAWITGTALTVDGGYTAR